MAYTQDTSTSEGLLRTMIYDTSTAAAPVKGTDYNFDDAELTAVLDENTDDLKASAADLCRALAAKFAKEAIELGLGKRDIYINKNQRAKFYIALASSYDKASNGDVSEYIDAADYDIDFAGQDLSEYVGDN